MNHEPYITREEARRLGWWWILAGDQQCSFGRWVWFDIGGTGPVHCYDEPPDQPRSESCTPVSAEPGTPFVLGDVIERLLDDG